MVRICNHSQEPREAEFTALRMEQDRSVHVLINHCREMKRQECLMRLTTAFFLFAIAAFFLFSSIANPKHCSNNEYTDETAEQGLLQRQVGKDPKKPSAHVTAVLVSSLPANNYAHWEHEKGDAHTYKFLYEDHALVVPQEGHYLVYLQITYRRPENVSCQTAIPLQPQIFRWLPSYQVDQPLIAASEFLPCKVIWEKSVYTSGIFKLEQGARLKVLYGAQQDLIIVPDEKKMFFGAYLI